MIIGLLRLATLVAGLSPLPGARAAPSRIALRRPRLLSISTATKQPTEKPAALRRLLRLLRGLSGLLQLPLQPLDAILRLRQSVLLHEGELSYAVASLGILAEGLADEGVSLPVDWRNADCVAGTDPAAAKPDC